MPEHQISFPTGLLAPDVTPTTEAELVVWQRLSKVIDPEIRLPITDLGMVGAITFTDAGLQVDIRLTIAGCPMRSTIEDDVRQAVNDLTEQVSVTMTPMTAEQRAEFTATLKSSRHANPFDAHSLTKIYAVASGKGGVGKSTVTVNLAVGLARRGLAVGVIDADIHGFSIPGLMGVTTGPTKIDEMILPPVAHGVKVISIGTFLGSSQPVAWRGPMLHRALEQFITDVAWGDLDVLLVDLPPGTGDIAISTAQLLPAAQILVVTTPQAAAAEVAARAGQLSTQTQQPVAGVIENMGPMTLPDGSVLELFGSGGGQRVADTLTESLGRDVPLLGSVPLDPVLGSDGDAGTPTLIAHPDSTAGAELQQIVDQLAQRPRGLRGKFIPLSPR